MYLQPQNNWKRQTMTCHHTYTGACGTKIENGKCFSQFQLHSSPVVEEANFDWSDEGGTLVWPHTHFPGGQSSGHEYYANHANAQYSVGTIFSNLLKKLPRGKQPCNNSVCLDCPAN